jgi:hypothetical protein
MKGIAGLIASTAAARRFAAFRKAKREQQQHAQRSEGAATSSTGWPASSIVMSNPYLVQSILDFVGPGQHLFVSTISKLVRQSYLQVKPIERHRGTQSKVIVHSQMTQYREMCRSEMRLMLAVRCSAQRVAAQRSMLKRTTDRLQAACGRDCKRKAIVSVVDDSLDTRKLSLLIGEYAEKSGTDICIRPTVSWPPVTSDACDCRCSDRLRSGKTAKVEPSKGVPYDL